MKTKPAAVKFFVAFLCLFIFNPTLYAQRSIPVAVNDSSPITPGIPVTLNILANDTIPPGDSIRIFYIGGSLLSTINPDLTVTFVLNQCGITGVKTMSYIIKDFTTGAKSNKGIIYFTIRDSSYAWLDINNVKARFNASGLHFLQDSAAYEVPKGSGKTSIFCHAFWIGGMDSTGQLHLAGERYRQGTGTQSGVKHDFWAGPVSNSSGYNVTQDRFWNYIWKISRSEIEYHRSHYQDPWYQAPRDILTWPAHGNTAFGQQFHLAPFSDRNANGIYDPMDGDYPEIRGDQALFFIFNDDHGYHSETTGEKLRVEIHGMAYAFDRPNDTAFKNTTFLHYKVINRSQNTYTNTWFGTFTDIDLGYVNDDYMGCDPERGMFYGYNGTPVDGTGQSWAYGANPPMQAVVYLGGPRMDADGYDNPAFRGPGLNGPSFHGNCTIVGLDSTVINMKYGPGEVYEAPFLVSSDAINGTGFGDGVTDNERLGMNRFVYFSNSNSGVPSQWLEWPYYAPHYYQILQGVWKDDSKMNYGGNGHPSAGGYGPVCNFMFPGLSDTCNWGTAGLVPNGIKEWTEKTARNNPRDRRGNASSGPITFGPGDVHDFDVAFAWAREYNPQDSTSALNKLNTVVDTIRKAFAENRVPGGGPLYGISDNIRQAETGMKIHPNPARDMIFFDLPRISKGEISLVLLTPQGKTVRTATLPAGKKGSANVSGIESGLYILQVRSGNDVFNNKVIVVK